MASPRKIERLCLTMDASFCNRLRTSYPHRDFSGLVYELLIYADAAGFMERLSAIEPDDYLGLCESVNERARRRRPGGKPTAKQINKAAQAVLAEDLEEFGS